MHRKLKIIAAICAFGTVIFAIGMTSDDREEKSRRSVDTTWSVQLNELNYLVMKASSINMIRGLHFNQEQTQRLLSLSVMMQELMDAPPVTGNACSGEVQEIRNAYLTLTDKLLQGDSIASDFKEELYRQRKKEADLIRFTLLGAQRPGYMGKGCIKCHCEPKNFPRGSAAEKDPAIVTAKVRQETDLAHVEGLLGKVATEKLWEIKDQVWLILNHGQQCVAADFRCCLLPTSNLLQDERIGQAASTDEWKKYLDDIRKLSNAEWEIYKPQFLDPIKEIIRATLPGIKTHEVEKRIAQVESIISTARKLGKMDYEIQKEAFCASIQYAISIDDLNGESFRSDDERKFIAAMFLLYYESDMIYKQMLEH
jgi:hypothetical protein